MSTQPSAADLSHPVPSGHGIAPAPESGTAWPRGALLALAAGIVSIGWALFNLAVPEARFAVESTQGEAGLVVAGICARIFAALVLFLLPSERALRRLRWVALGMVVQVLGGPVFTLSQGISFLPHDLTITMYGWVFVHGLASLLFLVGLAPSVPPLLTRGRALAVLAGTVSGAFLLVLTATRLPELTIVENIPTPLLHHSHIYPGLTAMHWITASSTVVLGALVIPAAYLRYRHGTIPGWLLVAVVLLAGAELHNLFWPAGFSPLIGTDDLLRLAAAITLAVGAALDLRSVADERHARLQEAEQQTRHLENLMVLKTDFTAMLAHEIGTPLSAVRRWAEMLETGELDQEGVERALAALSREIDTMGTLVQDMRSASAAERNDFSIHLRYVAVSELLSGPLAYARSMPGNHHVVVRGDTNLSVWADPDRIGQVLRNLLGNASKYSPEGSDISVEVSAHGNHVRIAVTDQGRGVHPDDVQTIFEKFGRGRDTTGRRLPGIGLGLYICRRIIRAHGSDITVESVPGQGSSFSFELASTS